MGLTIHYRGKLKDQSYIHQLIYEVKDIADIMDWPCSIKDEDWLKTPDAIVEHSSENGIIIKGHTGLKGITFQPHPRGEYLQLFFNAEGELNTSLALALANTEGKAMKNNWIAVKTPFGGVETHVAIIKLLRHLKKRYLTNLEVTDEGNYWEKEDIEELRNRFLTIGASSNKFENALADLSPMLSGETLIQRIEDILQDLEDDESLQNIK